MLSGTIEYSTVGEGRSRRDTKEGTSLMATDRFQIADGEQLLFEKGNPTFHRSSDLWFAVSEAALHWQTDRLFGGKGQKMFPLSDIKKIIIRPVPFRPPWIRLVACLILAAFPGVQLIEDIQSAKRVLALATTIGLIAICMMGWYLVRATKDRTEMAIMLNNRSVVLETPEDNYADEKAFDQKIVRELGVYLRMRGLRVVDRFEAES